MARPRKNNADYFPHDAEERNRREIRAIRNKFGPVGFAVWNMLKEQITGSDNFRLKIEDGTEAEVTAADMGVSTTEMIDILNFCCDIGEFQRVDKWTYTCAKLVKDLEPLLNKREYLRQKYTNEGVSTTETRVSTTETPQSKDKGIDRVIVNNKNVDNRRLYGDGLMPIGEILNRHSS